MLGEAAKGGEQHRTKICFLTPLVKVPGEDPGFEVPSLSAGGRPYFVHYKGMDAGERPL